LCGLCAAALALSDSLPPAGPAAAQQPAPQMPAPGAGQPQPAPGNPSALDAPLRMIAEARQVYQRVQDYTCTLITQERVKGRLGAENVVQLRFRQTPFSVSMKWLGPKEIAGREVVYFHGKNQNRMRVKEAKGLAGIAWWNIEPNDPRVFENSRHTILESGIGNLIEQFGRLWALERQLGKAQVQIAEYEYAGSRCTRVETVVAERHPQAYCHRAVVYFDQKTKLPIRVECYDWPVRGGAPQGELLECFSYVNISWNVGLRDTEFTR
jgi:hypothetical protein